MAEALEGVFDVEARLRVLREAAERALGGASTSEGAVGGGRDGAEAARRLVSEAGERVLEEALEECARLVEQQGRYRSEIARLRGEKALEAEQLASLQLRVKAFEQRSGGSDGGSPDALGAGRPGRDWVKVSATLANGIEPREAVLALKETARSRGAFEDLQALVARQIDSGTMETLHLVKRLSALDAQLAGLQAEAEEMVTETTPSKEEE